MEDWELDDEVDEEELEEGVLTSKFEDEEDEDDEDDEELVKCLKSSPLRSSDVDLEG